MSRHGNEGDLGDLELDVEEELCRKKGSAGYKVKYNGIWIGRKETDFFLYH